MNQAQTPSLGGTITRIERRWIWLFALAVMVVTSVPYLIGYSNQGEQWEFTGFVFGVEDGNSYIAKMLSGAKGAWLFRTPYTTQTQAGVIAFLPYILAGKLSAAPAQHEQLVVIFHLFRIFSGFLVILATYSFIAFFVQEIHLRRLGTAIAILGGGLGWLLILLGQEEWLGSLPLDFYSPETFGFLSIYGLAHLNLARAALLWGLTAYLKTFNDVEKTGAQQVIKIGGLWLLAALAQPLTAIVFGLIIGLHLIGLILFQILYRRRTGVSQWKSIRTVICTAIPAGLIPLPFIFYNLHLFRTDPFLIVWTAQNIIKSPHPWHYVLAYGMMAPFAYQGARRLLKSFPPAGLLPVTWVIAVPLLAYSPFNLQRRLPEGVWVAIVLLALYAFRAEPDSNKKSKGRLFPVMGVLFISSFLLLTGGILAALNPSIPVFRAKNEVMAFNFLAENAKINDVVLAAYSSSNALPAWAPVRVVVGHGPESVGGADLTPKINSFYRSETTNQERALFLTEMDVKYVFWGPDERAQGDWDPGEADFLMRVFANSEYSVFAVKDEDD